MVSSIGAREPESGELDRRITIRLREDLPVEDADLDAVFTQPRHRWAKIRAVGTAVYTDSVQNGRQDHASGVGSTAGRCHDLARSGCGGRDLPRQALRTLECR